MSMTRYATARWEGDLKTGQGRLDSPRSGLMAATPYGFNSRFGDQPGTNPEELIAAAHAGCFSMALAAKLSEAGHPPTSIETRADVELTMEGGPSIASIKLKTQARVPGIEAGGISGDRRRRQAQLPGIPGAERRADRTRGPPTGRLSLSAG